MLTLWLEFRECEIAPCLGIAVFSYRNVVTMLVRSLYGSTLDSVGARCSCFFMGVFRRITVQSAFKKNPVIFDKGVVI